LINSLSFHASTGIEHDPNNACQSGSITISLIPGIERVLLCKGFSPHHLRFAAFVQAHVCSPGMTGWWVNVHSLSRFNKPGILGTPVDKSWIKNVMVIDYEHKD
jgi:hypothetical protein